VSVAYDIRPARKSDAAEVALLVNIAVHGGIARGWAQGEDAEGTYAPLEVGRLQMMNENTPFNWRSATMAEYDGEVVGMLLGYRKSDEYEAVPKEVTGFMRPIEELEAESNRRWFISMLGVHRDWRGKGVGSSLLDVAGNNARETNAHGLSLIVEEGNGGARRLYARHGYAVADRRPMVRFEGEESGENWLLMVKE
jgi:ribosomal protein S18 acetylase RimI-like enzyme